MYLSMKRGTKSLGLSRVNSAGKCLFIKSSIGNAMGVVRVVTLLATSFGIY